MKKTIILLTFAGMLWSCGGAKPEPVKEEEKEEAPQGNVVEITEAQMATAGILLDTVQMKNLTSAIKANGMLTVPNQNKALVTSVTNGIVKTLTVQPGDYVKQGQVIATIINPDVAAVQRELQTTIAQINMAEIEERRQKELVEGNAAPLKNLQRVATELATLRATRNALQQQLRTMGISAGAVASGKVTTTLTVTAPISGTVSEVSAQIGSNVDASTPIAQIVNNTQLHLDLYVYEKDLPKLKKNQLIHFTLTNNAGKEYDAEIYAIGTAFASDTKTIPVHALVKGDKTGLIEGMNITAIVSVGTALLPAVPAEAITNNGGQDYIFVLVENPENLNKSDKKTTEDKTENKEQSKVLYFEKIPIAKGTSDIGFTEVTAIKPLGKGAKMVTKGAFFIMAKMTNTGGDE